MNSSTSQFSHSNDAYLGILEEAYSLLIHSYKDLKCQGYNPKDKREPKIRDDLVRIAQHKESRLAFGWFTEFRDLERENSVDIALIDPLHLNKGVKKAIAIECKIVSNGREYIDTKKNHSRVNSPTNGIMSFISNKYASCMPLAGMIGFIKEEDTEDKIQKIKERLSKHTDITTTQNLEFYEIEEGFNRSYESKHERKKNKPIAIYHLFFDFTV